MIDLANNINAFFDESRGNMGVSGLLSRFDSLAEAPRRVAVSPDLFYIAADAFPESKIRPLPLDAAGAIDISRLSESINERTEAVAVSTANLETGVFTAVDELALALSKISNTEMIVAETVPHFADEERSRRLRDEIESGMLARFSFAHLNGAADRRLANVSNIAFENMNGEAIAAMLFQRGFSAATGCACADASMRPSMTLREMNIPYSRAIGSMHFSFGDNFGVAEAGSFINALTEIVEQVRRFSFE